MDPEKNVGGRDRLVRAVLAAVLTVLAVNMLRSGKRKTGLLAGIGALGSGVTATTRYCGVNDALDRDTTSGAATVTTSGDATVTERTTDTGSTVDASGETRAESGGGSAEQKSRQSESLICARCGEPIRVGQARGPNEQNEIVHESCA